ncbi:MAG: serine/threonine protein kinase [Pseudomonadales bacterium]|nr:serine/threonine protein kinase [Pseudomonadales bacterium]
MTGTVLPAATTDACPVETAGSLVAAGRNISLPFRLRVERGDKTVELTFVRILRLLPGKRIVAVCEVGGDECLVKAYLGRSAHRYAGRERRGIGLLQESGVRTATLRWQGRLTDGHGQILAFDYLRDAISLQDRWEHADQREARVDVLTRAMVILGKLHNHGVVQDDIHLANFLLSGGMLYTIDGGHIVRRSSPPLREPASLENLGTFFAQFFPRFDDFIQIVLPAYEAVRGWPSDPVRLRRLARAVFRSREKRKKTYISKAFRDCTRFICNADFRRFEVCERDAYSKDLAKLLDDPDAAMGRGKLLKDGRTSTVALVRLPERSLVIKRYNMKSPWHRIRRAFRRTRAWTSWANACRMEFLGIPSVKPIALIEERFGPLRGRAWFITEYVEGQDALACLRSLKNPNGELEALTRILAGLSESRISHGDLKATNFVMTERGPVILDLDAMREHRSNEAFRRAFQRDLDRFMQNWTDRPELATRFEGLIGHLTP